MVGSLDILVVVFLGILIFRAQLFNGWFPGLGLLSIDPWRSHEVSKHAFNSLELTITMQVVKPPPLPNPTVNERPVTVICPKDLLQAQTKLSSSYNHLLYDKDWPLQWIRPNQWCEIWYRLGQIIGAWSARCFVRFHANHRFLTLKVHGRLAKTQGSVTTKLS